MIRYCFVVSACLSGMLLNGCGGGADPGPPRFDAQGKVTYNNEPIPYGEIMFEPDDSKGNTGPGTSAVIKDGAYTTSSGKGVISGDLKVRITGYDGNPPPGGGTMPHGKPLFPEYSDTVQQPEASATHDFTITGKKG